MKLWLVPTPIGNLDDITLRALLVLKNCDLILAEDTRTSKVLLNHFQIQKPLWSYHQHNEHGLLPKLIAEITEGKQLALISDAGTPGISDPGFLLVRECIRHQIPVECLPGATAFVPALVNSGFPINRFLYEGFLPLKKGRKTLMSSWVHETRTLVFYESPHRLLRTLKELQEILGDERRVCVFRELSKHFEEHLRGTLADMVRHFTEKSPKGELVVVIDGADE